MRPRRCRTLRERSRLDRSHACFRRSSASSCFTTGPGGACGSSACAGAGRGNPCETRGDFAARHESWLGYAGVLCFAPRLLSRHPNRQAGSRRLCRRAGDVVSWRGPPVTAFVEFLRSRPSGQSRRRRRPNSAFPLSVDPARSLASGDARGPACRDPLSRACGAHSRLGHLLADLGCGDRRRARRAARGLAPRAAARLCWREFGRFDRRRSRKYRANAWARRPAAFDWRGWRL